jgi:hypothetical protein
MKTPSGGTGEGKLWTASELANKAKRPNVWKRLLDNSKCEKHWPAESEVERTINLLIEDEALDAAKRIEDFHKSHKLQRENLTLNSGYDR